MNFKKHKVSERNIAEWGIWPLSCITVTLSLPHPHLSPNAREHWGRKASRVKKARETAALCALSALGRHLPPRWVNATLQVTWYSKRRHPDPDNALSMLKASIDGLGDAGLFENDRALKIGKVEVLKWKYEKVELCVTQAAE